MKTSYLLKTSAALAALAMPTAGFAQDTDGTGFYLGLDVGLSSVNDTDVTYYDEGGTFGGTGSSDTATGRIDTDNALSFGGALGYDFGTIRSDLEIDYTRNKISAFTIDSVNGSAVTLSAADRAEICDYLEADTCGGSGNTFVFDGSRVRQLSAMANLWLDLPIGSAITPYAGGGIGVSGFELDGEGTGKFAWQIGAGIAANVSGTTAITLDFRHRRVSDTTIEYDDASGFTVGDLKTNTFSAGLRFTF